MSRPVRSRAARVSTAYLLTCAAIGVAASALMAPAWVASSTLFLTVPFATVAIAGLWVLPAVIALRLLQRPGAGLLVGLISGLVLAPFFTIGSVATMLYWSFFPELPFLVTLYRRWNTWLHYAGSALIGATYPILSAQYFDLWSMTPPVLVSFIALCVASCVVATWLGILVGDRLRAAGVATLARRRTPA
ncbi:ECF transporter S component [Microbacterium oleivorans]|uniref:ECF transporter S component n=1 Tax=Microbacterium oleivorans TaxID=273677 RepID=A0A7D5IQG5_9MICO|nr:ECF transporter S component [Microbacterium oleivorans]QLD11721.1 ECF transporter S component [Microbacterium oleivorans]